MHFGATLRLLRVDAGFSLRDLADRLGVSNAYLSRVENGHDAAPTPDRLVAIARTFGLPPTMLIELADRMKPLAADYLETVPAARELLLDVVRRKLGPIDIARIRAFIDREFPTSAAQTRSDGVTRMLDPSRVVIGLTCADLEDAIDVAATRLADEGERSSAASIAEAILTREQAAASALGGGLAIPHAMLPRATPRAVVVTLRRPLKTDTPDGVPLRLLIVHLQPAGSGQVTRLANLADLARLAEPELVEKVAALRTPEKIVENILDALAGRGA
ncbi:MAG: transcriptional regulator [Labilithrix sp.]|nr:transcriptional regulator [Labilithrix sp.]